MQAKAATVLNLIEDVVLTFRMFSRVRLVLKSLPATFPKCVVEPVDIRPFCCRLVNFKNVFALMDVVITKKCSHKHFKLVPSGRNHCFFRLFNPSDAFVIFFNSKSTRSLLGSLPRQAGFAEKSLDFYHETFHKCAKNFASCEPPLIVSTPNSLPIYSSHVSVPVSIHKGHKQHL